MSEVKVSIEIGNVVRLKSGGPAMTVTKIDGLLLHVAWFDHHHPAILRDGVPADCLILCPAPGEFVVVEKVR